LLAWLVLPWLDRYLYDGDRFDRACAAAQKSNSAAGLRDYLADPANTRHRAEAKEMIDGFYDRAIDRLKQLHNKVGTDPRLHAGLLALLEALKTTEAPVMIVGFRATQEDAPVAPEHVALEKLLYEHHLAKKRKLRDIAASAPGKTVILPRGSVFDSDQTALREAVILDQLRKALAKVLDADLLSLARAGPDDKGMIEIAYRVYAPGRLYLYVESQSLFGARPEDVDVDEDEDDPAADSKDDPLADLKKAARLPKPPHMPTKTVKGLLRGYELEWTIAFRTPGQEGEHVCRLPSSPANQLKYDSESGDPLWAPYAIMLHSGFVDMGARLVKGFGLEAASPPDSYSFATATGQDQKSRQQGDR
jgi:hypothetical protein